MEYVLAFAAVPDLFFRKVSHLTVGFFRHVHDHFIPHARNNYHPHILGHRALALFSALLVTLKIFTLTLLTFGPVLPAYSSAITSDNIIYLTNQSREQYGLKDLVYNSLLAKAAQTKADDMLARGYFSHNTPDGRTPWSFIVAAGYNYLMAGENLAVNFTEAENVETAWMNSPGHRANILNKNFEEIGIGISEGEYQDHTAIFVVQMFGVPAEQQIQLSDKPTPVQTSDVPAPKPAPVPQQPALKSAAVAQSQATTSPEAVKILSTDVQLDTAGAKLTVQTNNTAIKVVAYYGDHAIMLAPKSDGSWQGELSVPEVAAAGSTVRVKAYDMAGNLDTKTLADFASSTPQNFSVLGATSPVSQAKASFFGRVFDPKNLEQNFYLFFIAGMLASLVLAIGIRRHVQHVAVVANASFVVILAVMLWMAG